MKEFKEIKELNPSNEFIETPAYEIPLENENVKEYLENKEIDNDTAAEKEVVEKKSRRTNSTTFLSTSLISVLAAVVVGITTLLNVAMTASMIVSDYNFTDGSFNITIDVKDITEKESLFLMIYEDGKEYQRIDLDLNGKEEVIENKLSYKLVKNEDNYNMVIELSKYKKDLIDENISNLDNYQIKYEFKLYGIVGLNVEREFDSYLTTIEKHTCEVRDVTGHCACQIDGYYHFTIDYTDPNSALTFNAYIIDSLGNRYDCVFTENLHDEQGIYVGDIEESKCRLYISYKEIGKEEEQFIMFDNGNIEKDNYKNINL